MSVRGRLGLDPSQFRITRGAMLLALAELGLSLVWLLSPPDVRQQLIDWLGASGDHVIEHGRVWTLVTSVFLEPDILGILLQMMIMWTFVPTLERFWGTPRFFRFAAITSLAGTVAGSAFGYLTGNGGPEVFGLSPFTFAAIVAFGVTYAHQPVKFFGVLPLTGRQLMFGIIGFLTLSVVLQGMWVNGVAYAAAMGTAALMTSKWSPSLAWKRRKIARARAKLTVLAGGQGRAPKSKRDDHRYLN